MLLEHYIISSGIEEMIRGCTIPETHRSIASLEATVLASGPKSKIVLIRAIAISTPLRGNDDQLSRPFEAASSYISRGTRHTLKHAAMLDILIKEMTDEFGMEEN